MSETERTSRINAIWRDIARQFPAVTMPFDIFFNLSTWRMMGTNLLPSVTKDRRARRVAARLEGVSREDVEALTEMAKVNAARAGDLFRAVAVVYISVPIALGALVSDAAPDLMREQLRTNIGDIVSWVIIAVVTPLFYFFGMWRAKQLLWTLELYKAGAIEPWRAK